MRLFVGLDLSWELRQRLSMLAGGVPGARWAPVENYHLTLRFIGDVQSPQADEIDHALASVRAPGFDLTIAGIGVFQKGGRSTSLWAGVDRNPALDHLQTKIETALQRAGLAPERRRFSPHITLARLNESVPQSKLAAFVQSHNLFRAAPERMTHFTLFSSRPGKEASVYEAEVEYELI